MIRSIIFTDQHHDIMIGQVGVQSLCFAVQIVRSKVETHDQVLINVVSVENDAAILIVWLSERQCSNM